MKKYLSKIIILIILILPISVKAAPSGNLSCSASSNTITVGDTVTVTINGSSSDAFWDTTMSYDSSLLSKIGGNEEHSVGNDFVTSVSYSYKFKALAEGSAFVKVDSAIADYNGEKTFPSTSCSINVVAPSSNSTTNNNQTVTPKQNIVRPEKSNYSSDNSLKSLSIEGVNFDKEFQSDILEYNGTLLIDEKTEIKIDAEVNDEKSSIRGIGTKEIDLGFYKFEVEVEAENGSFRAYIINLTVNEKTPIEVKIDNKKYTVMRKIDGVEVPNDFEKSTITIEGKEVEVFKSINNNHVLVILLDENNNSHLFIYKNNKYTKYTNIKSNSLNLVILNKTDKKVPYKYKKYKFYINGEEINGYAFDLASDFRLVYALNLDTNEKDFYLYDIKENTFQRFFNRQSNIYINLIEKCKIAFIIFGGIILLQFFIFICMKISNKKIKKKINNYNIHDDIENQLKDSIKKDKKEKVKKQKEKTFLDE